MRRTQKGQRLGGWFRAKGRVLDVVHEHKVIVINKLQTPVPSMWCVVLA
jgi:hypothetical protein